MSQRESIARVLAHVDSLTDTMLADAARVVRLPSVSGTDGENEGQAHMATLFDRGGLEVDHWSIDLDAIRAHGDFPGMEVERTEAWGLVGRLPGSGDGATLMLNGHIDVVPDRRSRSVVGRPVQRSVPRRPPARPGLVRHEGRIDRRTLGRTGDPHVGCEAAR